MAGCHILVNFPSTKYIRITMYKCLLCFDFMEFYLPFGFWANVSLALNWCTNESQIMEKEICKDLMKSIFFKLHSCSFNKCSVSVVAKNEIYLMLVLSLGCREACPEWWWTQKSAWKFPQRPQYIKWEKSRPFFFSFSFYCWVDIFHQIANWWCIVEDPQFDPFTRH